MSAPQKLVVATIPSAQVEPIPPFIELAAAAARDAGLHDALDGDEIEAALTRLYEVGADADAKLDRWDWVIAGSAGLLAGVVDAAFVDLPQNPITRSGEKGGALSSAVRSAFGRMLPPETVTGLEQRYPVAFDHSTNHGLLKPVPGLYPLSHRFQSPGHDPVLGWKFGVRDQLAGTFTGIGRDGTLVVQQVTRGTAGQGLFIGLLEAFRLVGGHMLSDVATPMGLPSPLLPLAQFLQFGNIGPEKYTIAETARRMYLEGYDFRHFVAGGLTTLIVEIIVRGAWLIRRLDEGRTFRASLPDAAMPRLRRQLLLAHATAAAVDGGKICITKNPIALNWAQWLAVLRYLVPEIEYSIRHPAARASEQNRLLDADLRALGWSAGTFGSASIHRRRVTVPSKDRRLRSKLGGRLPDGWDRHAPDVRGILADAAVG